MRVRDDDIFFVKTFGTLSIPNITLHHWQDNIPNRPICCMLRIQGLKADASAFAVCGLASDRCVLRCWSRSGSGYKIINHRMYVEARGGVVAPIKAIQYRKVVQLVLHARCMMAYRTYRVFHFPSQSHTHDVVVVVDCVHNTFILMVVGWLSWMPMFFFVEWRFVRYD